ncbi:hypothetical protein KUF54_16285 [Comamonas sp. Y33R10-2]|uniref:polyhydroxyalkanoate granule-associated phasin n=1 Tax=Comamonas sp. Y33R10-2 TaxID=2853257 RepID=UPI001C5CC046|nr:polyhydroxyalkanoate granule-associated phasin [Comamonas sp. Y33R10-2]QXZ09544.1 hypothetical protein KUF54_16285 [Comamonas sp. Y33R10-2]
MAQSPILYRTASELLGISMAAPQVIQHRLTRMALSGPVLSARDQQEFTRMVQEKQAAFSQAWWTMGAEMFTVQQQMCQAWLQNPWAAGRNLPAAMDKAAAKSLAPIRRKAQANAKRLSKTSV